MRPVKTSSPLLLLESIALLLHLNGVDGSNYNSLYSFPIPLSSPASFIQIWKPLLDSIAHIVNHYPSEVGYVNYTRV